MNAVAQPYRWSKKEITFQAPAASNPSISRISKAGAFFVWVFGCRLHPQKAKVAKSPSKSIGRHVTDPCEPEATYHGKLFPLYNDFPHPSIPRNSLSN